MTGRSRKGPRTGVKMGPLKCKKKQYSAFRRFDGHHQMKHEPPLVKYGAFTLNENIECLN